MNLKYYEVMRKRDMDAYDSFPKSIRDVLKEHPIGARNIKKMYDDLKETNLLSDDLLEEVIKKSLIDIIRNIK